MEQRVAKLEARVDELCEWRISHADDQREDFEALRKELKDALSRPPVWTTFVVSTLTCVVGVLAGALWALT